MHAGRTTVDGVELAWDEGGTGPVVVCLHAIGHDARDFAALAERLGTRYRVLALDWPGQGRSGADRTAASAARYAALLDGFLDACGVGRAVLIGNSIGGAAAIQYAAAHPARVAALVLENPGGLAATTDPLARLVLGAMVRFFAAGARGARWYPSAFAAYYRLVLRRPAADAARRRIVARARATAPVLVEAWRSFARPEADLRALIPAIRCPVLFAWARNDSFVQLGRSLPAIRRFADARLVEFRAGHAAHLEEPARFESLVEEFLAGVAAEPETGARLREARTS